MTQQNSYLHGRLFFYVFILATIGLYWAGLRGPFVLDDQPNLSPLQGWQDGQASAMELIFGNGSGILGRPVSMATLWFSAASGGMHPFPFKFGNLLIHIACGLLGWQLLRRLLEQEPRFAAKANVVAAVLAGLWLLHPINVSTVLYAVQRMAQLSTLFALAAVWTYVLARRQLAQGDNRSALIKLFVVFPVLLALGLFSKENAAVAPALCLVVELAYFLKQPRTGKALPVFYGTFLLIPATMAVFLLITMPGRFISYATRDFTLVERLLSQPRALMEYLGLILWPRGGQMGVFVDDFMPSTGLLAPPSTLIAIVLLLGISGFAIALRKQAPSFFAGWFFFLVAHGVESTFLPLELYFEHRNYLPTFGILLAVAGLLAWGYEKLPPRFAARQATAAWALAAIAALGFSAVTWQQVQVWRSEDALATQAMKYRPQSLRGALSKATVLVQSGQLQEAQQLTASFIDSPNPRHRLLGNIHTLVIDCLRGKQANPVYLRQAEQSGVKFLTIPDTQAFVQLGKALDNGMCGPDVTYATAADSIEALMLATPGQPDSAQQKWSLRTTAADFYRRAGQWQNAQRQAELAWHPEVSDTAVGGLLVNIYIEQGDKAAAQRTLDQVRKRVSRHELAANESIAQIQLRIDAMGE